MQEGCLGISSDGRPYCGRACYNAISLHLPCFPCFTLDDCIGRIWSWCIIIHHQLTPCPWVVQGKVWSHVIPSEISFLNPPRLRSSSRSISSSLVFRLEPSIFLSFIFRFSFHFGKFLKSPFPCLAIVQIKIQTSITTLLAIVALIVIVVVVVAPRTRDTPLVFLGSPLRLFRNSLGRGQLQGLTP